MHGRGAERGESVHDLKIGSRGVSNDDAHANSFDNDTPVCQGRTPPPKRLFHLLNRLANVRSDLPGLQPGSVLLHIGVHKTGTTAVQSALMTCRPFLDTWNVRYPGITRAQHKIAVAGANRSLGWKDRGAFAPQPKKWKKFLREAREYDGITVLSSEFLAESNIDVITNMINDLGSDRVHVVVTMRNLAKIMPSAWQQFLKGGYTFGYEEWLGNILTAPKRDANAKLFWARHQHDEVVQRWSSVVGADQMSVIVVDESVREGIFWEFEDMLGLPKNTLVDHQGTESNRSMTIAETEFLRKINADVAPEMQWPEYRMLIRRGLIKGMVETRSPEPDEPKLLTPQWALDRAAEISGPMCDAIEASGVHIRGNMDVLRAHLNGPEHVVIDDSTPLPVAEVVAGLAGVVRVIENEMDRETKSKLTKAWEKASRSIKR